MGKAVGYAGSQWSKMTAYLDCVELTPDNNLSENAIRPFVIGRKMRKRGDCVSASSGAVFPMRGGRTECFADLFSH